MRRLLALGCCLMITPFPARSADLPRPTGETVVSPDAKLELLFTRSAPITGGLTEGPAVAPDGSIYFSDIPFVSGNGMILRFDPRTKQTTVFAADSHKANGLEFDPQGRLVACEGSDGGGRCISRWDIRTKIRTVLADRYMGKRFNAPNDLNIDARGRIYFTDPRYRGTEPRELEHRAVYRLDTDGTLIEVTHDVGKPNGIALSPDAKTLYVADYDNGTDRTIDGVPKPPPAAMKVCAYPLGANGLVNGPKRTVVDFGLDFGCDGMTVDNQGRLYLASRNFKRPGVLVVDPAGKEVAFIPTGPPDQPNDGMPKGLPSNVTFGIGPERNMLYVTIDVSLYRIPVKAEGHIPWAK
jgi:gluconolactonase